MSHQITKEGIVPNDVSGSRFDQVVAHLFPEYSRARLQLWIKEGAMTLDGQKVKPKFKVFGGEAIHLNAIIEEMDEWLAEPMDLQILHEDDHILIVNKPSDLVVHPAPGNYSGTLLNGLLHYLPDIAHVPRAGIVHRLDKDTTGLMVVAKTLVSQNHLVSQMQARSVSREYLALVIGACPAKGLVNDPIGRDPKNRKKMAVVGPHGSGKEAKTHFKRIAQLGSLTLVQLKLETGRTHQIRVHMASIGFPIVGDLVYGKKITKKVISELKECDELDPEFIQNFSRQALHARHLSLTHPDTQEECSWSAPLPTDMIQLINACGGHNIAL